MNRVLITGATGFIGRTLCEVIAERGYAVRAALREASKRAHSPIETVVVGDVDGATSWEYALDDVEFAIHLAAIAHRSDGTTTSVDYRRTNADGTRAFARAAARAGVKRFVYLSSIKVNGELTNGMPFRAEDVPAPQDDYGRSKRLAEDYLMEAAKGSSMEYAIVRPPLVYGPRVGANFLRLMQWIHRSFPLPFAAVENQRSLVSIWNLCDLLVTLLRHPQASGRVWMVSDGDDVSTPELIRRIARSMKTRPRLFPVPEHLLSFAGRLVGRVGAVRRLCDSLVVDISRTREDLHWVPSHTIDEGLDSTVQWYLNHLVARSE